MVGLDKGEKKVGSDFQNKSHWFGISVYLDNLFTSNSLCHFTSVDVHSYVAKLHPIFQTQGLGEPFNLYNPSPLFRTIIECREGERESCRFELGL